MRKAVNRFNRITNMGETTGSAIHLHETSRVIRRDLGVIKKANKKKLVRLSVLQKLMSIRPPKRGFKEFNKKS